MQKAGAGIWPPGRAQHLQGPMRRQLEGGRRERGPQEPSQPYSVGWQLIFPAELLPFSRVLVP